MSNLSEGEKGVLRKQLEYHNQCGPDKPTRDQPHLGPKSHPYTKEFNLSEGDTVKITLPSGDWAIGLTLGTHKWYGPADGWYIEMDVDEGSGIPKGYAYYKQNFDGGVVEKLF